MDRSRSEIIIGRMGDRVDRIILQVIDLVTMDDEEQRERKIECLESVIGRLWTLHFRNRYEESQLN